MVVGPPCSGKTSVVKALTNMALGTGMGWTPTVVGLDPSSVSHLYMLGIWTDVMIAIESDTWEPIPVDPTIPNPDSSPLQPTRFTPYYRSSSYDGIGRTNSGVVVRPPGADYKRSGRLEEACFKYGSKVCGSMC